MIAEKVVSQLLKRLTLPEDLARLIYYVLIKHHPEQSDNDENCVIGHVLRLHSILSKLPPPGRTLRTPIQSFVPDETSVIYMPVLNYLVEFDIPPKIRFEHTHILGATGSGKTQLIQRLIFEDIKCGASVIVMAPKGNLISNIARILPEDKVLLIDPRQGIGLNLFDMKGEKESVVSLINYIFSSIVEAGTTSKQTVLLNYCIRLVLASGGTLLTLRSLLQSETLPDSFQKYLPNLSPIARDFFQTQFSNKKQYGETKEQLMWRIDLLMENEVVYRMFAEHKTSIDIRGAMDSGTVVLIDTKPMGDMGSSFLGRFFIALIALASQQRDTSGPLQPVYVYIDEASTYLGENIAGILERARESRVGLTLAHQQLDQLKTLQASVMTNTSTKFVGSVNHDDARQLAHELLVDKEALQHQDPFHFHVKVKGFLKKAVPIVIAPGFIEQMPKASRAAKPIPPIEIPIERPAITHSPDDDIEALNKR